MALAETAKLVASLELKDRFTPAANKAMASLGKLEGRAFRVGQNIGKGFQNAAANIRNIGLVAGAGLALAVRGGIGHLVELENATTSVDGAIKQMGLTGQVSSAQVATWANDIEASVGAAFDDKEIVAATATLLRFGKVTPSNLRPAMQVITDLAVKTGSVDSAATLLAKALADPTKAAGKLSRQGVVLTKIQQNQIKAFVKAGKTAEAQKVILDALTVTTKGAAAASQGPYKRAMSVLADVTEDAQKALATGFLPVLEKVAGLLSTELAKPQTLNNIREFGVGLAGGLDKLIDIARGLPWSTIGASLKLAGQGAKTVLDMFTAMPPWVQTAILTGWGLNKLTGGALGGIVKELAGGLIKGVLGMTAGVVNINAGVVRGPAGGMPVTPAGSSGWGSLFALIGPAVAIALASKLVTDFTNQEFADKGVNSNFKPPDPGLLGGLSTAVHNLAEAIRLWQAGAPKPHIPGQFPGKEQDDRNFLPKLQDSFDRTVVAPIVVAINTLKGKIEDDRIGTPLQEGREQWLSDRKVPTGPFVPTVKLDPSQITDLRPTTAAVDSLKGKISDDLITVKTGVGSAVETSGSKVVGATQFAGILNSGATAIAGLMTAGATVSAGLMTAGATTSSGLGVEAAIRASRPIITTNVSISATSIVKTNTVIRRYGNTGGDREGSGVLHNGAN